MTCRLRWCVEMETICRIPIWQTFGRIQWHVIPEPRITLQGAATWWIYRYDSRASCHIAGCSHLTKSMSWSCHITGCKNSIRHIERCFFAIFFLFLMQFRLWQAAAYVSSPIHLLIACCWRHKIPQTSNLQLAYSIMMSKTAVQKRPITVPVWGGCDVLWGRGSLGPSNSSLVTSLLKR